MTGQGRTLLGKVTAICISKQPLKWNINGINFHCDTFGYKPIQHHDNDDMERLSYLTNRYNRAVEQSLKEYPQTEHILVVDSYYVTFANEIIKLVDHYGKLDRVILGASIWYWEKSHLRPSIRYYDHRSAQEMRDKKWFSLNQLPKGFLPVTGVGGCFIFRRTVWEESGGFFIPRKEPQAGGSRCLRTDGYTILLDCDCRLWRTHANNPGIPEYSIAKRMRVSFGAIRRQILKRLRH